MTSATLENAGICKYKYNYIFHKVTPPSWGLLSWYLKIALTDFAKLFLKWGKLKNLESYRNFFQNLSRGGAGEQFQNGKANNWEKFHLRYAKISSIERSIVCEQWFFNFFFENCVGWGLKFFCSSNTMKFTILVEKFLLILTKVFVLTTRWR